MKNKTFFRVCFAFSIVLLLFAFSQAQEYRGYVSIGSEVFFIALPVWIVELKISQLEKANAKLKKENQKMKNYIDWENLQNDFKF